MMIINIFPAEIICSITVMFDRVKLCVVSLAVSFLHFEHVK